MKASRLQGFGLLALLVLQRQKEVLRVCVEKSGTTLYLLLLTNVWLSSGQITMSTGNTAVPYVEYVNFFSVNSCIYRLTFKVPSPSFKSLSRRLQRSQLGQALLYRAWRSL